MITPLKSMSACYANNYKVVLVLFLPLLALSTFLVFQIKYGLIFLGGAVLFSLVLIKPKLVYYLLLALFSMEGIAAVPGASYDRLLAILLIIGLTLRLAMTKGAIPKDSSYKFLFLILLGSLASFVFAKDLPTSLRFYLAFISLFLLYGMTRYFMRSIEDIHGGLNYLFFSTLLIIIVIRAMGLSTDVGDDPWRISGGIGDPNEFASFILVLLPLAYYRATSTAGVRKLAYVSFLALLVFTGSRGGILGFLGAASVLVYYYSIGRLRQLFFLILLGAIILFFVVPPDFWSRAATILHPEAAGDLSIDLRMANYRAAAKMFLDHPLAGVGLRNFQFNCQEYGAPAKLVVHNTYLEVLTGGGLLCFIPFLLVLADSWRKLRISPRYDGNIRDLLICSKASFISLLITSSFISIENKKIMWFLFALISAVFYIARNRRIFYRQELHDGCNGVSSSLS
jgi:hypothetical protein